MPSPEKLSSLPSIADILQDNNINLTLDADDQRQLDQLLKDIFQGGDINLNRRIIDMSVQRMGGILLPYIFEHEDALPPFIIERAEDVCQKGTVGTYPFIAEYIIQKAIMGTVKHLFDLEQTDHFERDSKNGFIAFTQNGSMLIGYPVQSGGDNRRCEYYRVPSRQSDEWQKAAKINAPVSYDLRLGRPGMVGKLHTSILGEILVIPEGKADVMEDIADQTRTACSTYLVSDRDSDSDGNGSNGNGGDVIIEIDNGTDSDSGGADTVRDPQEPEFLHA